MKKYLILLCVALITTSGYSQILPPTPYIPNVVDYGDYFVESSGIQEVRDILERRGFVPMFTNEKLRTLGHNPKTRAVYSTGKGATAMTVFVDAVSEINPKIASVKFVFAELYGKQISEDLASTGYKVLGERSFFENRKNHTETIYERIGETQTIEVVVISVQETGIAIQATFESKPRTASQIEEYTRMQEQAEEEYKTWLRETFDEPRRKSNEMFFDDKSSCNQGSEPLKEFIEKFCNDRTFQKSRTKFPNNITAENWTPFRKGSFTIRPTDSENGLIMGSAWGTMERNKASFVWWVGMSTSYAYIFERINEQWFLTRSSEWYDDFGDLIHQEKPRASNNATIPQPAVFTEQLRVQDNSDFALPQQQPPRETTRQVQERQPIPQAETQMYSGTGAGTGGGGVLFSLSGRMAKSLATPEYNSPDQGTVVVRFWVNKDGVVIRAEAGQRGTTVNDRNLWKTAETAALKSSFNADNNAPEQQVGTITYRFIKLN
jgi:hypothetical protein